MDQQIATIKICLVGSKDVGRTSLFWRYRENKQPDDIQYYRFIEYIIKQREYQNKQVNIIIWNTQELDSFIKKQVSIGFYRNTSGFLIIFDITNRQSFVDIYKWLDEIQEKCNIEPKIILIGNKSDLESNRQVSYEEAQQLADSIGIEYFEVSALNSINVNYCFERIQKMSSEEYFKLQKFVEPSFLEKINQSQLIKKIKNMF